METNQKPRKNHETTLKNHRNQPKTMKHHETNLKNHGNQPKTIVLRYVTNTGYQLTYMIKEPSRHQHRVPTDHLYVYIGTFGTLPTAGFRLNKNALPIPKLFRMCFRIGKIRLYGFFLQIYGPINASLPPI